MTRIDQICQEIDQAREDVIELTRALVKIPTLNPPGNNFTVELIRAHETPGDSDRYPRWNLVARHEGGSKGECIHFNSHTDVVEVGSGWTTDPFAGELIGDRLFGRGTCDMKGGLAASIVAVESFLHCCPDYRGSIEISATADEESGGFGGVAYLAQQGYFSPQRVQHVIIPEPLNKDRICLGHRGVWWAEIETHGHIAHGSMPFLGDCAVRHMGAVISEMEHTLFPALQLKRTEMPVVPDGAKQSTLNINSLHGGQDEAPDDYTGLPSPVVPDSCRMIIDRRYLLEEDLADVKQEVYDVLTTVQGQRSDFRYDIRDVHEVLPTMAERDAPIVEAVTAAISDILGKKPDYVVSPGTYDQKHIDRIGQLKNCIAYGPGMTVAG